jgi:hypothetical protein
MIAARTISAPDLGIVRKLLHGACSAERPRKATTYNAPWGKFFSVLPTQECIFTLINDDWLFDIQEYVPQFFKGNVIPQRFSQRVSMDNHIPMVIVSRTQQYQKIAALIDEIEGYRNVAAGWDGHCDEQPNPRCLDAAKKFARALDPSSPLPEVAVSGGDDVMLYWRKERQYLAVKFNKNSTLSYYYKATHKESAEEGMDFTRYKIPSDIRKCIREIAG